MMRTVEENLAAWNRELTDLDDGILTPLLYALRVSESINTFRRRVLEPFELSVSEYDVLASLRQVGAPYRLNPSTLCERLDRSSGGMTKLLNRLEAGGYLDRVKDPEDGRGSLVVLSRRGLELQTRIFGAFLAATENRFGGLGRSRLAQIEAAMKQFCEALDR
jgi:DNA-binding MarR family transcriptional regulator